MHVELVPAQEKDLPVIRNLSRYYIYDMSEFMGWPCPDSGVFGGCDDFFADWAANRNKPYIIRVDGELAGFTGVVYREVEYVCAIQEFFILRKFRERGIGRQVALELFDRYPGDWIVEVLYENLPAMSFWISVINDYTDGQYSDSRYDSPWGEMKALRFPVDEYGSVDSFRPE